MEYNYLSLNMPKYALVITLGSLSIQRARLPVRDVAPLRDVLLSCALEGPRPSAS